MHGHLNVKFVNAKQAKKTHQFRNTKENYTKTSRQYCVTKCAQENSLRTNIPLLCVQWKTHDDGQRNCTKHVQFYSKNIRPDSPRKLSENLYEIYHSCVYSEKLMMMDRGTVRNMYSFIPKISVLILLASCQKTCMKYTIAVCTVKNSWWWAQELYETCRVLFQK